MRLALRVADAVERAIVRIGEGVAWLTFLMAGVTCAVAVLRYGFSLGWIWLQETITWMHAAVFLLAAGYTLARDEHVRVDIFYRDLSPRRQALVNLCGCVVFLLPLSVSLVAVSLDYVQTSWLIRESSREAGGLIFPFPSLLKTLLPVTGALLGLQALVIVARSTALLLGVPAQATASLPRDEAERAEAALGAKASRPRGGRGRREGNDLASKENPPDGGA